MKTVLTPVAARQGHASWFDYTAQRKEHGELTVGNSDGVDQSSGGGDRALSLLGTLKSQRTLYVRGVTRNG
jgi:hypothetical protein